jgi:two-component system OmpR family sensor kinase
MVVGWMGMGFLLVAAAHTHRVTTGREYLETDLIFGELRLLGMLTVLVGTLQLLRGGVQAVRTEKSELQEELQVAAVHMQRAAAKTAERDHELRNGLAGLTGITQLLSDGGGGGEHERLRGAVLRELARLAAMLEEHEGSTNGTIGASGGYDVTPVLVDAVMLQQAAGVHVDLSSPPGLLAGGHPDVLAHVVTNLLANCARHAAGARVRVRAQAVGGRVRIEVADDGPGIPPGHESLVLERGVRGPASRGDGLGLCVSRELLEGIGGSLRIVSRGGAGGGCTVVVELPGPTPAPRALTPGGATGLRSTARPRHVEEVR